jgi:hypothetical protein
MGKDDPNPVVAAGPDLGWPAFALGQGWCRMAGEPC